MPHLMRSGGAGFASRAGANKLDGVNRAPRWLLPAVLTALVLTVVAGALLN
ncbi:MAG TPA: hypothetical protein VIL71_06335 [Spirillospora sp.]